MQETEERLEAAKRFIGIQINAIRQDPDMTEQMFEAVRDSVINEFDRFMQFLREQGFGADYATAYDEGYTKALEHLTSRSKAESVPTPAQGAAQAPSGAIDGRSRYSLAALTVVGQQIVDIPRPAWSRVRNALHQLKHRTGREYAVLANERTGMMRVILVKAGQAVPSRRSLARAVVR